MPRPSRWNDLVEAAAEEFAELGFDRATIEGIAARVGILKGSVYHYVRSKEELLFAVIERPAKELLEYLADLAAADISASDKLRALFQRQIGLFADFYPAAFVYLGLIGRSSQPKVFRDRDAQYMNYLEGILQEGVERGEFQLASTSRVSAFALVGILDWMQHWFNPRDRAGTEELADALFSFALGGLAAGAPVLVGLAKSEQKNQPSNDTDNT